MLAQNLWTPAQSNKPSRQSSVVVKCSCDEASCCRVVKVDSVRRALERQGAPDPLECPAHSHGPKPTQRFFSALKECKLSRVCIWDWCCIPGHPRMHVDAIVVQPNGLVHMFEVDGSSHWQHGLDQRSDADIRKDALFVEQNQGLLRLHFKDEELWKNYIEYFSSAEQYRVKYTDSYRLCLESADDVIWL